MLGLRLWVQYPTGAQMTKTRPVDYSEWNWMQMEHEENPQRTGRRDGGEAVDDGAPVVAPSSPRFPAEQKPQSAEGLTENKALNVPDQAQVKPRPASAASGGTAGESVAVSKWLTFWRGVLQVDASKMDAAIGLRNALGVALPLAIGIAIKMPLGGLAVASGALNVSYSDGHDPYKQRAWRMLATSALCAVAVMAGGLAGHYSVAAAVLTSIWAFGAGLAITLGPTAESQGVISVVVLIIFAAQVLTPERALQAGALAFAGGVGQMLLSLVFWPVHAYEPERRALSNLYLALGDSAASPAQLMKSSPPGVEASTRAQEALAGRISDHSVLSERFRSLLNQAERTRLRLFTLGRLLRRMRREKFGFAPAEMIEHFLESTSHVMKTIGESLQRNTTLKVNPVWLDEIRSTTEDLRRTHATTDRTFLAAAVRDALSQMEAIGGQVRAAIKMAGDVTPDGIEESARREKTLPRRMRFTSLLPRVAANLSFRSAVFRHGVRLAATVAVAETVSRSLETPRAYWLPMTAVLVLKPEFTVTFTRGLLRIAGTMVGLLLATAMFHFLPTGIGMEVALIGAFVFLLRWAGPANYGIFGVAVSALVVLMIAITGVSPKNVIWARGLNTISGGTLALIAYSVWPTWERTQVGEVMARLLDSYRVYFTKVVEFLEGREGVSAIDLDRLRLASRLARTNALASVDRMQAEPGTRVAEIPLLTGMLASSHRFIHAVLSVEAGFVPGAGTVVRDEFRVFARDVDIVLGRLAGELRRPRASAQKWPDLREDHRCLVQNPLSAGEPYALVNIEADRMTNSLNTLREQAERWCKLKSGR
jgi:uncharacterized membrane protein YccC